MIAEREPIRLVRPFARRARWLGLALLRRGSLAAALLVVWVVVADHKDTSNNGFPTIQGVAHSGRTMIGDGSLGTALATSWDTVLRGFVVATALGVPLGLLLGYVPAARNWLEPVIDLLRPIAPFAWIPMAILWFGGSRSAGVMITSYAAFFPIVTNTFAGVSRVQRSLVLAARTLGASEWRIFSRVVLAGALPMIMIGLRLGVGMSWAAVIAAEIATGQASTGNAGLGYLLYLNLANTFDMNTIVFLMIAIGVSTYAADVVLRILDRRLVFWPTES